MCCLPSCFIVVSMLELSRQGVLFTVLFRCCFHTVYRHRHTVQIHCFISVRFFDVVMTSYCQHCFQAVWLAETWEHLSRCFMSARRLGRRRERPNNHWNRIIVLRLYVAWANYYRMLLVDHGNIPVALNPFLMTSAFMSKPIQVVQLCCEWLYTFAGFV